MNFKDLRSSRVAIKVEAEDNELFCNLAEEYGFANYPAAYPIDRSHYTLCYAHGFGLRPLNGLLSSCDEYFYQMHEFPIIPFTEFEEYFDEHTVSKCPLNLTEIYDREENV